MDGIWTAISQFLASPTSVLGAAIVSALVSAFVQFLLKKYETRDRLQAEYEHEQRKCLRELIGRYHGRLLQACISLSRRFSNLYSNYGNRWLDVRGHYGGAGYYYTSFVHRFLNVCALVRRLEREALYLDSRIARHDDYLLLEYLATMQRTLTDVDLFRGLNYDRGYAAAHFFADKLRDCADACWSSEEFIRVDALTQLVDARQDLNPVLRYFDSLHPDAQPLRWDRLVAFHLLIQTFINRFGHPADKCDDAAIQAVALQVRQSAVLKNLVSWLQAPGLRKDGEIKRLVRACRHAIAAQRAA